MNGERAHSVGTPISDLQGPIGPGFSRPKHKRTFTGLKASEIKNVEASIPEPLREAWVLNFFFFFFFYDLIFDLIDWIVLEYLIADTFQR